ncbi:MAG TPA: YncE family protein, partial [Paraburkholderia sp.]
MRRSSLCRTAVRVALSATFAFAATLPVARSAAANNIIVLNSADATLTLVDEATQQVVGTVPTGKEPHHLFPTPDNTSLIVANSVSNNLMFVDPKTGQPQRWLQNIEDPYQLGFSPDRK